MFETLDALPPDALLNLIKLYDADPNPAKIDLGVGVYRAADGSTPVFRAIKEAERRLLNDQHSKAYLGPEGDLGYVAALRGYVFADAVDTDRVAGVQTPGGTGALRLACEMLASSGCRKVFVGQPSWPNHAPIIRAAGLEMVPFQHADMDRQEIDFDAVMNAISDAEAGDCLLLHGACHNPTGIDYSFDQWQTITKAVADKGLMPLVDLAYHGLGDGFEEDAAGMRELVKAVPEALVAYSCDKNFGLYRERVGALFGIAESAKAASVVASHFAALARANWSMPPDHGAASVRIILEDETLTHMWLAEVQEMRDRLSSIRGALAGRGNESVGQVDLAATGRQKGLFSTLKLSKEQIVELREKHSIYMAGSGRINIAGFTIPQIDQFVEALIEVS